MTPFKSDLIPRTIRDCSLKVKVANGVVVKAACVLDASVLIRDRNSGQTYEVTLHDVLCVPGLSRRLIPSKELQRYEHMTVHHNQMDAILFNMDDDENQQLAITVPSHFEYSAQRGTVNWSNSDLDLYGSTMQLFQFAALPNEIPVVCVGYHSKSPDTNNNSDEFANPVEESPSNETPTPANASLGRQRVQSSASYENKKARIPVSQSAPRSTRTLQARDSNGRRKSSYLGRCFPYEESEEF
jgi:hypothetical protein